MISKPTPDEFLKGLSEAVVKNDITGFDSYITRFASFCFKEPLDPPEEFPDEIFQQILLLIGKQEFQQLDETHRLLLIFEYDWGLLSELQKEHLLIALRDSYDKYKDWMSSFVISELLGEYYCNEASFLVLTALEKTANESARALVPHGYEHIAREATSEQLRRKALSRLQKMKNDPSVSVRNEVAGALAKIPPG